MHKALTRREWMAGAAAVRLPAQTTIKLPQQVRLALIGLEGHIGEILDPLDRLPDVKLVAVCDRNAKQRALIADRFHAHQYASYQEMLDREQLDMAGVCGTNDERAPAIIACAKHKLHIIAEKPLALNQAELAQVKDAVAESRIGLTMLISMRFEAPYLAIKQIVDAGEIGEVAQIGAQKSYKLGERPEWMRHRETFGGTIPYIGIHMVDLMRYTSGREMVEAVSFQSRIGFPEIRDMENTAATLFRMDNGGVAALRLDYLRPETAPTHGDDRLRLAGTRGVVEYQEAMGVTLATAGRKPQRITQLPRSRSLFVDFLDSIYRSKPTGLKAEDCYRATEIVLAARESAERRAIVKL